MGTQSVIPPDTSEQPCELQPYRLVLRADSFENLEQELFDGPDNLPTAQPTVPEC